MRVSAATAVLGLVLAASAAAQVQDEYLDYFIVKVKPEKQAEFATMAKKIVDANRKNNGDQWLAVEMVYGDNDTVAFTSSRKDMGAIDTANDAFMKALKTAYGDSEAVMRDFSACLSSSHSELRRRRWDLSLNAPRTAEDYAKYVGNARYIRTLVANIKPGRSSEFEEMIHTVEAAMGKADPEAVYMVSQLAAGQSGGSTYYVSTLVPSLGKLEPKNSLKDAMGAEAFKSYENGVADIVLSSETLIGRFRPDLSNPPDPIVQVTRDFWMPPSSTNTVAARAKKK